ncbi:hypothetical protein [Helicobacter sp. MIT 05-5293]|uniref:hypothetical protein n=1 Tax=Helicobacter sp. MIT 05-5293 TaxID=1548149 RepID=UPI000A4FD62D|nr:hypothetical protein [Helicobacter sp. MIT 05-5293]
MNKLWVSLALVFSLSISPLAALESSTKLNQADTEFLFGTDAQNVDVIVLSEDEMEETTGEFWGAFSAITGLGALIYEIGRDHHWW